MINKVLNKIHNKKIIMICKITKILIIMIFLNLLELICLHYHLLWKMVKFYNGMLRLDKKSRLVIVQLLQKLIKLLLTLKIKMMGMLLKYYNNLMVIELKLENHQLYQYKIKMMFKNLKILLYKIYKKIINLVGIKVKKLKMKF